MEENKIIITEQTEQTISRDEVLERSRKENAQNGDEREQKILQKGISVATVAGLVVLFIVYLVNAVVLEKNSYELVGIIMLINGINSIWQSKYGKKRKKAFLSLGIAQLIVCIAFMVLWILTLCGF